MNGDGRLDCFVAALLAMTLREAPIIRYVLQTFKSTLGFKSSGVSGTNANPWRSCVARVR